MKLDELIFPTGGRLPSFTPDDTRAVIDRSDGTQVFVWRYDQKTYNIVLHGKPPRLGYYGDLLEKWLDLDPLSAQAILCGLCGPGDKVQSEALQAEAWWAH